MTYNRQMISTILIAIGGLLGVVGAFLAARQSISDGQELDRRNNEIIELTKRNAELSKEALENITGGKTYAFIRSGLDSVAGISNQEALWNIHVVGTIPLF